MESLYELVTGKKVLITGASGLCGRGLAFVLARANEVHGLARFRSPAVREELESLGVRTWTMDMGLDSPDTLPADYDVVIHEATAWGKGDTLADQERSFAIGCRFIPDLMARCERAVFALVSTGGVYLPQAAPVCEDETRLSAPSDYPLEKIAAAQVARWVGRHFGRRWVDLRYFWPFGAWRRHGKVDLILQGKVPEHPVRLLQRTYVQNHIHYTLKSLALARPEGEALNVVTTEEFTPREAALIGARVAGVAPDPAALAADAPVEQPGLLASTEKLARLLGPAPVRFETGLRRYLRARRENIPTVQEWMLEPEG